MELHELPDASTLDEAATTVGGCLDGLAGALSEVTSAWSGLESSYTAPEAHLVYHALDTLDGAREELERLVGQAKSALSSYASQIPGLASRRSAILSDIYDWQHFTPTTPDDTNPYDYWSLNSDVQRFNADAEAADGDCASALAALHRYYTWTMSDVLDVANSTPAAVGLGTAQGLLKRYRTLWVPGEGAALPDIPRLDQIVPDEIVDGKAFVRRPSGLLVPLGSDLPAPPTEVTKPPGWHSRGVFTPHPELVAPPRWVRRGGKVLSVVGAGLTYWGEYSDRYNETLVSHPEWSDDQRTGDAVTHSAVVGSAAVGGGALGAWGGAAIGASIGSIFPGPGTVIGGIIGGIIGGVAGGMAGEAGGSAVMDAVDSADGTDVTVVDDPDRQQCVMVPAGGGSGGSGYAGAGGGGGGGGGW